MPANIFDQFDPPASGSKNIFDQFDPQPATKASNERTWPEAAADLGVTALKGAIGLPQAAVGLADIVSGGRAGRALEDVGFRPDDAKKVLDSFYSEPQQAANRRVEEADGFVDTTLTALQNPSVIAHTALESIPSMLGGAGVARGLIKVAPKVAPWAAGAVGEGVVGAGAAAEEIRGATADRLLTPGQSAAAIGSGLGTAAFGAAGGKLAHRLGIGDIDTMLAGGASKLSRSPVGFVRQVLGAGISEGVFEELPQSMQEQMWQNFALGKPLDEGVGKAGAMGLLTGAAMGAAGGGYNAAVGRSAVQVGATGNTDTTPIIADEVLGGKPDRAPEPTAAEVSLGTGQGGTSRRGALPPEARLVELELLAESRGLAPSERDEVRRIVARLGASEIDTDTSASSQSVSAEVMPPVASDSTVPANFWAFVRQRGFAPQDLQIGSPKWAALRREYVDARAGGRPAKVRARAERASGADGLSQLTPPGPAPSAAETALLTPRALTSLDRVDAIDRELAAKPADAPEALDLHAERAAITKDWPASVPGAETTFTTEENTRLAARYALMESDALVTSHDASLRANPAYPAELQPRERERAASAAQISGIVQKLDPARLGLSADAATGAPIVGADRLGGERQRARYRLEAGLWGQQREVGA